MNLGVYFNSTSMMLLKALMNSGVYFSSTSIMLLKASNEFRSLLQFYIYDITGGFKDVTEDSKWVWGST
jgi:hypothetical protein